MNRLKTQERKGIILIYGCFSLECTNSPDDNLLKGFSFYYCRWSRPSGVPLFLCNPSCSTLERWSLASKSCFISPFYLIVVVHLPHFGFFSATVHAHPLCHTSDLVMDLALLIVKVSSRKQYNKLCLKMYLS